MTTSSQLHPTLSAPVKRAPRTAPAEAATEAPQVRSYAEQIAAEDAVTTRKLLIAGAASTVLILVFFFAMMIYLSHFGVQG